jgi:hypothetical protein
MFGANAFEKKWHQSESVVHVKNQEYLHRPAHFISPSHFFISMALPFSIKNAFAENL